MIHDAAVSAAVSLDNLGKCFGITVKAYKLGKGHESREQILRPLLHGNMNGKPVSSIMSKPQTATTKMTTWKLSRQDSLERFGLKLSDCLWKCVFFCFPQSPTKGRQHCTYECILKEGRSLEGVCVPYICSLLYIYIHISTNLFGGVATSNALN